MQATRAVIHQARGSPFLENVRRHAAIAERFLKRAGANDSFRLLFWWILACVPESGSVPGFARIPPRYSSIQYNHSFALGRGIRHSAVSDSQLPLLVPSINLAPTNGLSCAVR